jgi:hypothetical protein
MACHLGRLSCFGSRLLVSGWLPTQRPLPDTDICGYAAHCVTRCGCCPEFQCLVFRLQVGCAFNHREFYANKQSSDVVETCNFTFGNDRLWKAMDASILTAIRHVDGTATIIISLLVRSGGEYR